MQERHKDRRRYFEEQSITTEKYVIPYINSVKKIESGIRVLEIGCGEGGNLPPFIDLKCEVVGIDINKGQIANAKQYILDKYGEQKAQLFDQDIYDVNPAEFGLFDIVFLRDVIEHIPNQARFMGHLKSFIKSDGVIFFGFPPWAMPFGGHQQVCSNKIISKMPYIHLLPNSLYAFVVKMLGGNQGIVNGLLAVKSTGISINRFQRIVKSSGFQFLKKDLFLINPNYEIKFGLKPRHQIPLIKNIPYFRDLFTTCYYCILKRVS